MIEHNNREFVANNVDGARISDNVCYVRRDIREVYNELFGKALEEYNSRQTQASRKIHDYYDRLRREASNAALPHLHIDFIPIAYKLTRGPAVKVSMKNALREQGFTSANRLQNEWAAWEERERGVMIDILRKHDLSRDVKNVHRAHLTVDEYKDFADKQQKIRNINAHINELKKKNPADLTPDEAELINNQNDFLRSEIQKRDESISALSEKLGAKFVPFDIFSEDKLQFVAAPCVFSL
ncbi:MAG: plasmid recombination protein [Bacteroides sp.]|nr:plasmid recombination protein [Bacteroides sp.]